MQSNLASTIIEQFVKDYHAICAQYPAANTRTFHNVLKAEAKSAEERNKLVEHVTIDVQEEVDEEQEPLMNDNHRHAYGMV